jgi:hypothetical protein
VPDPNMENASAYLGTTRCPHCGMDVDAGIEFPSAFPPPLAEMAGALTLLLQTGVLVFSPNYLRNGGDQAMPLGPAEESTQTRLPSKVRRLRMGHLARPLAQRRETAEKLTGG